MSTTFLGHRLAAPVVIAGMTGGHERALEVNRNLAQAAAKLGIAIGTGSQRAALAAPALIPTYSVVREHAPDAVVIGNLGMCQLIPQGDEPPFGREEILSAVAMIEADLLAIHLNAVEELIQPEGDRSMRGILAAIANCVAWSPVPVIAKETGAGMTRESAASLASCGVHGIDVGGVGGTSFARIEALRAREAGDARGSRLGETFGDWGVPTALSIIEASTADLPLIATGGVRNGLHAAKAIALGASLVGVGGPAIIAARSSADAVIEEMTLFLEELRVAMTL
ncbi:MAG: type 2 isopentenyl-diphosphate Delta-isomerase, partial [Acidimicrobiales bacterium]